MIRIGIIGVDWRGKQIVTSLATSPRFKMVAGCDIDTTMAAPFAAAHKLDLTATTTGRSSSAPISMPSRW